MAKLSKPPIPLKMYKHFAVVTLLLTATIAMFADSDNRQAIADHAEERQRMERLREVEEERFGQRELVRRDDGPKGSFGDEGSGYGQPTSVAPSNGGGSGLRARNGRRAIPGYSREYLNSLPQREYEAIVASLPDSQQAETGSHDQENLVAEMSRASARRSGRQGAGADAPG